MTTTLSYLPAWEFRQADWPTDTYPSWTASAAGDQLRLWLPDGLIGIRTEDDLALEKLAWHEARLGRLPRTWKTWLDAPRIGTSFYRVPDGYRWDRPLGRGVTVQRTGISVWPSPTEDGSRIHWRDEYASVGHHPPNWKQIPELPTDWVEELMGGADAIRRQTFGLDQILSKFIQETIVVTGAARDHLTTGDIYDLYRTWSELPPQFPQVDLVSKTHLSRHMAAWSWEKWAGRTPLGYRRGYAGVRLPDQAWREAGLAPSLP